jgi:hypothetical protein
MRPGCGGYRGRDRRRRTARMSLAAGAVAALVAGAPAPAQAASQYDGDATALRVEGLRLQLFPNGTEGLPRQLRQAVAQLQEQAPPELQRDRLALVMPDQVIGQAQFPGTDTQGSIPDNPLLTADFLEAKSVRTKGGGMLSESSVSGLELGGGVLSAGVIRTTCTGTGDRMSLDVSQLRLRSNQDIVRSTVSLEPGSRTRVPGLGSITFNEQETDGTTYAEATAVAISLDSDLSLDALLQLFEITPELRAVLDQVLQDVTDTRVGGQRLPGKVSEGIRQAIEQIAEPVEQGGDQAADEIVRNAGQAEALENALNNVAHLGGTVTVSNAACAQQPITASAPQPQQPQGAVPAQPVGNTPQPPLADTGSPAGMAGLGAAGLGAVVAGGLMLARTRRREA